MHLTIWIEKNSKRRREDWIRLVPGTTDQPLFTIGPHGKPKVANAPIPFEFSLSRTHSATHHWTVFTGAHAPPDLSPGLEIGIDVESLDRKITHSWETFGERFFSESELSTLKATPAAHQREHFFKIWTRKEAILKASGRGISLSLNSFSTMGDDSPYRLLDRDYWIDSFQWQAPHPSDASPLMISVASTQKFKFSVVSLPIDPKDSGSD